MIQHALCTSAKRDFLAGIHQLGDRYMVALYTSNASIGPLTTVYETSGEASGNGYKPGGMVLRNAKVWSDDEHGYLTFDAVRWPNSTITARAALIYNASKGNKAIGVIDFGGDYTSTVGDFNLNIPADVVRFL